MKSFPLNMTADGLFSTSFILLNRGDLDCNSLELAVFHSLHNLIPLSRPGVLWNCHMDLTLRYLRCEQADIAEPVSSKAAASSIFPLRVVNICRGLVSRESLVACRSFALIAKPVASSKSSNVLNLADNLASSGINFAR